MLWRKATIFLTIVAVDLAAEIFILATIEVD